MRWFKHITDTDTDERISALIDAMGMEGYGLWWRLLEIIAKQMDDTDKCDVTYSLPRWSLLLYCHHNKVRSFLGNSEVIGLCAVSNDGGKIKVTVPNLLKYRDNHTKNLQVTRKSKTSDLSVTNKQEVEVEVEVEVEYKNPPIVPPRGDDRETLFDEFWQGYPKRVGKDAARKAFEKRKPDALLTARMVQAVETQKRSRQWQEESGKFIPNPATWLNQGRWEDDVEAEAENKETWKRGIFQGGI